MSFSETDIHALYRLIYFSRAEVAGADELPELMNSILSVAVPRNTRSQVSGALLACDKWFVQALEGDRLSVGGLYQMICKDRRHRDAKIIKAGPISHRDFGGWSMCGQTLSPKDDAIIDTLQTKKLFDPATLSADSAIRLLKIVKNLQGEPRSVVYI